MIDGAGRGNRTVTKWTSGFGKMSKAMMVVAAAMSVYSVTVADDWKYELGHQVASWSGAIAGGTIGSGVGAFARLSVVATDPS